MADQVSFYGPIDIYTHKEGKEWVAYVDPFSVAGDGPTPKSALRHALRNLAQQLRALGEEIRKAGPSKVQVLCPLPSDLKTSSRVAHFLLYAVHKGAKSAPGHLPRVRRLSKRNAGEVLATSATISVVPAECQAVL